VQDDQGVTPIHWYRTNASARVGAEKRKLCRKEKKEKNGRAVHRLGGCGRAANQGNTVIVRKLLDAEAFPNYFDNGEHRLTPLDYALASAYLLSWPPSRSLQL
jgi:hypothetical protein